MKYSICEKYLDGSIPRMFSINELLFPFWFCRVSTLLVREGIKEDVETCGDEEKIDLVVDGVNKILDRVVRW